MVAESFLVVLISWNDLYESQCWVVLLLMVGLAASAAGSFRRERETGALELILVTPLSVGQIIFGRLRGVWGQFLPTMVLLFTVGAFLMQAGLQGPWSDDWPGLEENSTLGLLTATSFLTLPVMGLYCSTVRKTFLAAWLWTVLAGLAVPWLLSFFLHRVVWMLLGQSYLLGYSYPSYYPSISLLGGFRFFVMWAVGLQLVFAAMAACLLFRNLRRRKFAFA